MNSFLLLESGATRLEWALVRSGVVLVRDTLPGLHPFLSKKEDWVKNLQLLAGSIGGTLPDALYFYGTGCTHLAGCDLVAGYLQQQWEHCRKIEVASDLLAAARSSCQTRAGIVCILGTGSNAAYYNGRDICEQRGGLGFILGDEGSGADLGRILLTTFLNQQLPVALAERLRKDYQLSRETVIRDLYQNSNPSRYLAQFAPLVNRWQDQSPLLREQVLARFQLLAQNCLMPLSQVSGLKQIAFVGSIAWHFQLPLEQALQDLELEVKSISSSPFGGLLQFHASAE